MRLSLIAMLLLAGCGGGGYPVEPTSANAPQARSAGHVPHAPQPAPARWELQSSGEGAALVLAGASGDTSLRLFCPAGGASWLVNAPAFKPVGSEDRFSFGRSFQVATLVASTSGDAARGGVSGEGPLPANLRQLLSGALSASYGNQTSGPHVAPPMGLIDAFVGACLEGARSPGDAASSAGTPSSGAIAPAQPTVASASACRVQDGRAVPANALHAMGTEPFWGARVDGRCVTYSHPEDQAGTRVWTSFAGTASNGTWTGALSGKPFVMRTSAKACMDGMSETRYPITVSLTVAGEQRVGCAQPR